MRRPHDGDSDLSRWAAQRADMVSAQLVARGITDPRVLEAMGEVPRHHFVPGHLQAHAYSDGALPIAAGQTISQPFVVALMIEALELEPSDRVLEIGTGSGYGAAVLSRLAREVYTVERHRLLVEAAAARLTEIGYSNVFTLHGDGTLGWPENAPYDAIVGTAGAPDVPAPLLDQLAVGGRLVVPVGSDRREQELVRVCRLGAGDFDREELGSVQFVPMIGVEAWPGEDRFS